MKIIIPEPCHEDWEKMTPANQGSFCDSCAKIVVDFTKMKDHEVINYFENHKEQKTCGRFLSKQVNQNISSLAPPVRTLNQPINLNFTIPELKKVKTFTHRFIVALLIIFGNTLFTSCGNGSPETLGKVVSPYTKGESIPAIDTIKQVVDSTKVEIKNNKAAAITTKIASNLYSAFKKASAPSLILLEMNCILSSPGFCFFTQAILININSSPTNESAIGIIITLLILFYNVYLS